MKTFRNIWNQRIFTNIAYWFDLRIVCTRDWCNLFYLQCWCAPLRCYSTKKTCVLRSQRVTIRNYTRFECGMIINFLLFIRLEWGRMSPLIASAHRAAEHCVQKLKYLPLKYGEITTYRTAVHIVKMIMKFRFLWVLYQVFLKCAL